MSLIKKKIQKIQGGTTGKSWVDRFFDFGVREPKPQALDKDQWAKNVAYQDQIRQNTPGEGFVVQYPGGPGVSPTVPNPPYTDPNTPQLVNAPNKELRGQKQSNKPSPEDANYSAERDPTSKTLPDQGTESWRWPNNGVKPSPTIPATGWEFEAPTGRTLPPRLINETPAVPGLPSGLPSSSPKPAKPAYETVADTWQKSTGMNWQEARKLGLTDGSAKQNLALQDMMRKNPESIQKVISQKQGYNRAVANPSLNRMTPTTGKPLQVMQTKNTPGQLNIPGPKASTVPMVTTNDKIDASIKAQGIPSIQDAMNDPNTPTGRTTYKW